MSGIMISSTESYNLGDDEEASQMETTIEAYLTCKDESGIPLEDQINRLRLDSAPIVF